MNSKKETFDFFPKRVGDSQFFMAPSNYQESDLRRLVCKEKSEEEVFFLVVEGHLHQVGVLVRGAHEPVAGVQLPLNLLALHVCQGHKHRKENEPHHSHDKSSEI